MRKIKLIILMILCSCTSTPYDGKYTLKGKNVDYSIERKQCQIEATEKAIERLKGNEIGPAWISIRNKYMLSCMKEKGFDWVQE